MRLPQSFIQSFFHRNLSFLTFTAALLMVGMLPVSAFAATPQLVFTPTSLRFGSVLMGQNETLMVGVTNSGTTSITISGVAVGNSEFTMSPLNLPLVLAAGQSVEVNVSFTPAATGWQSGLIKFSTDSGLVTLQVAGTGAINQSVKSSPSSVSFGSVAIGSIATVPVVLTNTHEWKITLSSLQTSGNEFALSGNGPQFPLTLGPGQSVTVNVAFAPQWAGQTGGSVFITGPGLSIPLTGTGATPGQLSANPSSLSFGSMQDGGTLTLMDSLTNTGASSVTISQAAASGAGFSISGLNVPLVLDPGASVTFSVLFTPQAPGSASGAVNVVSDASDSKLNVALSGTGTAQGQLILAPGAMNFGGVTVGSVASQNSSFSASVSSVTISSANLSNAEFSLSGISFPVTIAAGQSVPVTLTFAPQSTGATSALLTVTSNAGDNPTETLSGDGVAQQQHSVALTWTDYGSGIAGYNVYRGSVTGGPYARINSELASSSGYEDDAVASGQTYYYVTTAVNENGMESAYSNEAQEVIPNP
jgi:hypothetical protein